MTVKEFVNGYKTKGGISFLSRELKVNPYISYHQKIVMSDLIVKKTSYKYGSDGKQTAEIELHTPMLNLFFMMYVIKAYTNIDVDLKNALEEYDMLQSSGLFETIWGRLPSGDINSFQNILNASKDDFIQNEMSFDAVVGRQVNRFIDLFKVAAKPILKELSDAIMKNIDENPENKEAVQKIVNFIKK